MGYYSEVGIAFTKDFYEEVKSLLDEDYQDELTSMVVNENDEQVLVYYDNVKWYNGYEMTDDDLSKYRLEHAIEQFRSPMEHSNHKKRYNRDHSAEAMGY